MDGSVLIQVLAWTCAAVFVAISIITVLALVGKIKFSDERYLRRLFYVLIVEVVGVGVLAFKFTVDPPGLNCEDCPKNSTTDTLKVNACEDKIVFYNPIDTLRYESGWNGIYVNGVLISSDDKALITAKYSIDSGNWRVVERQDIQKAGDKCTIVIRETPRQERMVRLRVTINDKVQPDHEFVVKPVEPEDNDH